MSHPVQRIEFEGAEGHALQGSLQRPVGPTVGVALFAHCFTCSKDLQAARGITMALAEQGFATLRFDFTGLGESAGEFAETTFSSNVADLVAAAAWLADNVGAPTLFVGHSLGGAAVYCAASQVDSVKAVASVGAPADPAHVEHLFGDDADIIRADGEAVVQLAGRPFRVKRAFLDDLGDQQLLKNVATLRRAVLVLHSPTDSTVGIDNARRIFEAARHPKSFVSLDGADHLLSRRADSAYAGSVIATWAARYATVPVELPKATHSNDVEVITSDGYRSDVVVRRKHRLVADEPTSLGGTDAGPTPYELVSAGLGSCTTITLRMVADRKGYDLAEVRVHVEHRKEQVDGEKVDVWTRVLELTGDLSERERAELLRIADRCPVHRTLHGKAVIETTLA